MKKILGMMIMITMRTKRIDQDLNQSPIYLLKKKKLAMMDEKSPDQQ